MNRKKNQQYAATDEKIKEALLTLLREKELPKVTVKGICQLSGINRSTFYEHYIDIYDLAQKVEQEIFQELLGQYQDFQPEDFLKERHLNRLLRHIKENREFYRFYLRDLERPNIRMGFFYVGENLIKPYSREMGLDDDEMADYYWAFYFFGLLAVIRRWLEEGCRQPPEYMTAYLLEVFPKLPDRTAAGPSKAEETGNTKNK